LFLITNFKVDALASVSLLAGSEQLLAGRGYHHMNVTISNQSPPFTGTAPGRTGNHLFLHLAFNRVNINQSGGETL
jgi:hypothetical protein